MATGLYRRFTRDARKRCCRLAKSLGKEKPTKRVGDKVTGTKSLKSTEILDGS